MNKTFKNAFIYMFKDEKWYPKIGFLLLFLIPFWGAVCYTLSLFYPLYTKYKHHQSHELNTAIAFFVALVLLCLFGGIVYSIILGYLSKCTQNIIKSTQIENEILPSWKGNLLSNYILGAKKLGARNALMILIRPLNIALLIPMLVFYLLKPALNRIFCEEFKFDSYIQWVKASDLIGDNFGLYLIIIILEFLYGLSLLTLFIVLLIFKIHFALTALCLSIYSTYALLTGAYLEAIIGQKKSA